jgi:hypothetical protein
MKIELPSFLDLLATRRLDRQRFVNDELSELQNIGCGFVWETLGSRQWNDPNFSTGFIVPLLSLTLFGVCEISYLVCGGASILVRFVIYCSFAIRPRSSTTPDCATLDTSWHVPAIRTPTVAPPNSAFGRNETSRWTTGA